MMMMNCIQKVDLIVIGDKYRIRKEEKVSMGSVNSIFYETVLHGY